VKKVLTPIPGESKPYDLDVLRELANAADDIPLDLPLEGRIATVLEDEGMRHCVCGGPSDGRFMLSCDDCGEWFHGHCVKVMKDSLDDHEEWRCPSCSKSPIAPETLDLDSFHEKYDADVDNESNSCDHGDFSPKAPDTSSMWPPFGLLASDKAIEVLGEVCCSIPDDVDEWMNETSIPDGVKAVFTESSSDLSAESRPSESSKTTSIDGDDPPQIRPTDAGLSVTPQPVPCVVRQKTALALNTESIAPNITINERENAEQAQFTLKAETSNTTTFVNPSHAIRRSLVMPYNNISAVVSGDSLFSEIMAAATTAPVRSITHADKTDCFHLVDQELNDINMIGNRMEIPNVGREILIAPIQDLSRK